MILLKRFWQHARLARDSFRRVREKPEPLEGENLLRWSALRLCEIHDIRLEIEGEFPEGAAVLVCNHQSWIDPFILAAATDSFPISKSEIASWPLVGFCARRFGVQFVRRDSMFDRALALRRALRLLAAGRKVANFPEGTTTEAQMLPFHRGIFGVAKIARVPIVPIHMQFDSPDWFWTGGETFAPALLRVTRRPRTTIKLTLLPPIQPSTMSTAEQLASQAHSLIHSVETSLEAVHDSAASSGVHSARTDAVLSPARSRS